MNRDPKDTKVTLFFKDGNILYDNIETIITKVDTSVGGDVVQSVEEYYLKYGTKLDKLKLEWDNKEHLIDMDKFHVQSGIPLIIGNKLKKYTPLISVAQSYYFYIPSNQENC